MASFSVFDSFLIIKMSQEWGRILYSPWQIKLKLKHMKNPSFRELRSLFQINQVCKEENQRRNLTSSNFAWQCKMPKRRTSCRIESKTVKNEFYTLWETSQALRNWGKWISHPVRNFASFAKVLLCNFQIFLHRLR